ncbi:putative ribonuclease H-like domain-containing protein, partial [Tanacetum coccineum]
KHYKTLSLDELISPNFNLFSDQEYSEEEVAETMKETMVQYMSKTRADYGSRVARPNIEDKDNFELKVQFLKELRTNTFSGLDHEDANEHIKKVLEIIDLFHIPNITIDQVMLRAFLMSLTGAASRWLRNETTSSITTWDRLKTKFLNKYCPPARTAKKMEEINNFSQEPDQNLYQAWERFKELLMKCSQHYLTKMQEVILFYNGLGIPTQHILDSRGAIPSKTAADAKLYKHNSTILGERSRKQSMKDTLSKFISALAKRHKENSNLIKEIQALTDAAIKNQGSSIKTLEIQIRQMSKNHTLMYKTRQMMIPFLSHLNGYCCEEKKGSYGPQFSEAYFEALHINNSIPQKEKDPGSFTLPCIINNVCFDNSLVDLGASVSVMPLSTYHNLRLGELAHTKLTVELADRTVKYPKRIAKNVLVGISKFIFPVDFIILDMPEDIKVPLILGTPFLSTTRAKIDLYKQKITLRIGEERIIFKSIKPASSLIKRVYMLSLRERMELDLEVRLMGETLVINRSLDPLNGDYIELNDLNEPFELRRNQGDDLMPTIKEGEVIEEFRTRDDELDTGIDDYPRALMNVPMFVGTFSVVTDFVVLENTDAYRNKGMGDVIFGEPFLREVGIKARRFEGMITIYNGNDEVTYQMVRSHPRFKNHTNEKCNKIPPLLKVSDEDKKHGI